MVANPYSTNSRYYAITHLNSKYFQKSTFFLYPILKIPKTIVPKGTYLSWEDHYTLEDKVFICVFEKFGKEVQLEAERKHLLSHPLYLDYYELENEDVIYVFSFKHNDKIIEKFLKGQYSTFSQPAKERIIEFYKPSGKTIKFINSYLHPQAYYKTYSELLNVPVELLEEVVELIDKPNLEKEHLTLKVKCLDSLLPIK